MIIHINDIPIQVEISDDHDSRQQGLMKRPTLNPGCGMLFVFPDAADRSFWMKNTYIPLSIAFIGENDEILNIEDMHPFDDGNTYSSTPARCALEMNQGWFQKNGIHPGDRVSGISQILATESISLSRSDLRRIIKEVILKKELI